MCEYVCVRARARTGRVEKENRFFVKNKVYIKKKKKKKEGNLFSQYNAAFCVSRAALQTAIVAQILCS